MNSAAPSAPKSRGERGGSKTARESVLCLKILKLDTRKFPATTMGAQSLLNRRCLSMSFAKLNKPLDGPRPTLIFSFVTNPSLSKMQNGWSTGGEALLDCSRISLNGSSVLTESVTTSMRQG